MNSNSLSVLDFETPVVCPNEEALKNFVSMVKGGIQRRGFHIADEESLTALWADEAISAIEKLQRVHAFASENGWEVAAKNRVTIALFQPTGRRSILPGMWRLCGMN
jgi:hypothetical protein